MAASIIVPVRTRRAPRAAAALASARSAPRGPGLATVVALPVRGSAAEVPGSTARPASAQDSRPKLRVVRPTARRRAGLVQLLALGLAVALLLGAAGGLARGVLTGAPEPVAAGHVVLQPGETLWDVAVRSAPAGVDPRRQLDTLRRLNGFGPGALDAWTVVLIPAV